MDHLTGLMFKASTLGEADPWFDSHWRPDFSGSSQTNDLKIGTPVATLPGAWQYRVSTGTGWSGVSILKLSEIESLTCSFYLSAAAHNCLSRFVPEVHWHVAWTLIEEPIIKQNKTKHLMWLHDSVFIHHVSCSGR